jgi:hypothetical protein
MKRNAAHGYRSMVKNRVRADLRTDADHFTALGPVARIWEIQRRLHARQPIKRYNVQLETLLA